MQVVITSSCCLQWLVWTTQIIHSPVSINNINTKMYSFCILDHIKVQESYYKNISPSYSLLILCVSLPGFSPPTIALMTSNTSSKLGKLPCSNILNNSTPSIETSNEFRLPASPQTAADGNLSLIKLASRWNRGL